MVRKEGHCYIWNETEGHRGSSEIATSLHLYLDQSTATDVVMFSDTCGGQNRNQYLSTMLLYVVNKHPTIKAIDYIFMVQGHSHMEVDSMHSARERKSLGLKIYDPYGWQIVAATARLNPYFVFSLKHNEFVDTKQLKNDMKINNVNVNEQGEKVKWKDTNSITWMRFDKEHPNTIFYRLTYNEEDAFKKIIVKRSMSSSVDNDEYKLPRAYTSRLPVSAAKLKDLQYLCDDLTIPKSHHAFYNELANLSSSTTFTGVSSDSEISESENEE